MQNKIIVTVAITLGLTAGAGMFWVWKVSQPSATSAEVAPTSSKASTGSSISLTQDSTPLTLGVSSGDALSDSSLVAGGSQNQSLGGSASGQGQAQASSNSSSSSTPSNGQGESATTDPTKFGTYDKYKAQDSALFADLTKGTGAEAGASSKVSVLYRGWLTNGQLFDQNMDTTKPFSFTIGAHAVIPGWEQTIYGMKVGGERLLIIPPAVGYGEAGQGPIPGNAVLVFYVKLLKVE